MRNEFNINEVKNEGAAVVLRVEGHLDGKSTPVLVERARKIRARDQNLILNLAQVTFIASNGVGGLLSMVEDFHRAGLRIRLTDLSLAVESVLKLLNLDQFLDIDVSETAALSQLEA